MNEVKKLKVEGLNRPIGQVSTGLAYSARRFASAADLTSNKLLREKHLTSRLPSG